MDITEAKSRIEELSQQLHHYNYEYYMNDRSLITDQEFDLMMNELIGLEEQFPELKASDSPSQRVGGTINKAFETVVHSTQMLSLANTYSEDELTEFDNRVAKGLEGQPYEYICELKFDGVAISGVLVVTHDRFLSPDQPGNARLKRMTPSLAWRFFTARGFFPVCKWRPSPATSSPSCRPGLLPIYPVRP